MPRTQHRLLQKEGLTARTRGGGFRSLTTIVRITVRATRNAEDGDQHNLYKLPVLPRFLNQLGSAREACPYFHTLPVV